jgi:hypothetical protein
LQANITILAKAGDLSETDLNISEVKIEDHNLEDEQNCTLVIASNVLLHAELLQTAVNALADGSCILAREKVGTESVPTNGFRLETVFEKTLKDEKLLLLRKVTAPLRVMVQKCTRGIVICHHSSPQCCKPPSDPKSVHVFTINIQKFTCYLQ